MRKLLALVYGVAVYGFFGLTWVYFVGFLGGFAVPKNIDSGPVAPLPETLAIDLGCLALFFVHHSVMARTRAKRAISRFVPPHVERSTYVLVASLSIVFLMWMWRPLPEVLWSVGGGARIVLVAVFWIGLLVTLIGSNMIDGLELFGVRQVIAYFRGRVLQGTQFRTPGLYRLVRHPMMTGQLLMFWATPTLTHGRLLFAVVMSGYILAAVKWLEERDLRRTFGAEYERYQREVPMLVPGLRLHSRERARRRTQGSQDESVGAPGVDGPRRHGDGDVGDAWLERRARTSRGSSG